MLSSDHSTFGLIEFITHGWKIFSYVTHESVSADVNDDSSVTIPITLARNFLDHISIKIITPSESYGMSNGTNHKSECHRFMLNGK